MNDLMEKETIPKMFSLSTEIMTELFDTAQQLVVRGKGLLAIDESLESAEKRFKTINVPNTLENRQMYREILISAPNIERYCSGIILHEETAGQPMRFNKLTGSIPAYLTKKGILPGVKLDAGLTSPLLNTFQEPHTAGLDNLKAKLAKWKEMGCKFSKWRAAIKILPGLLVPDEAIRANSLTMALYALCCQEFGIVPIIEPDILADGDHDIAKCYQVTTKVLSCFFRDLRRLNVYLEGTILKVNMITPGMAFKGQSSAQLVAEYTLKGLYQTVPAAIPGIVFLSGGFSEEDSTAYLAAINEKKRPRTPWPLTYSFGRALQSSAMKEWAGNIANASKAQNALFQRLKANSQASLKGPPPVRLPDLFHPKYQILPDANCVHIVPPGTKIEIDLEDYEMSGSTKQKPKSSDKVSKLENEIRNKPEHKQN